MKEFNFVETWLAEWQKENPGSRLYLVGNGDLYIGWTEKRLCTDAQNNHLWDNRVCGTFGSCSGCPFNKKIAVFTSIKFKSPHMQESPDQIKFRKLVEASGGITKVIKE